MIQRVEHVRQVCLLAILAIVLPYLVDLCFLVLSALHLLLLEILSHLRQLFLVYDVITLQTLVAIGYVIHMLLMVFLFFDRILEALHRVDIFLRALRRPGPVSTEVHQDHRLQHLSVCLLHHDLEGHPCELKVDQLHASEELHFTQ